MTTVIRESKETQIRLVLTKGTGVATVSTGDGFLDHMLTAFARYAGVDLEVQARGDMRHHLIEDVAITLGQAVAAFAPAGCARFGDRTVPMDDALVQAVIDIGGRVYYEGPLPSKLYDHFLRSFAENAKTTLHVRVIRGFDRHHIVEAAIKAVGFALRDALVETGAVFSTKGAVRLEITP
ncbi:MAG: imidazoleglycerol-phosphate dehydratase [Gemmatimonadota bacterium]|jgi:imidazoleglycerol-phosphate dehydratase